MKSEAQGWEPRESLSIRGTGLHALIRGDRKSAVLNFLGRLPLPPGSTCLELSGECTDVTVAAAERQFRVTLLVRVPAHMEKSKATIDSLGLTDIVTVATGSVRSIDPPPGTIDLVIATDLFPWDAEPDMTLDAIARLLRPGGYFIFEFKNRLGLPRLVDPRYAPGTGRLLSSLRHRWNTIRGKGGYTVPGIPRYHSRGEILSILSSNGLIWESGLSSGFGPWTFLGKRVLPEGPERHLHSLLQRLADRDHPFVKHAGTYYIAIARKTVGGREA